MHNKHKTQPCLVHDSLPGFDEQRSAENTGDDTASGDVSNSAHSIDEGTSSLPESVPSTSTEVRDRFALARRTVKEPKNTPYTRMESTVQRMHTENITARQATQQLMEQQNNLLREQNDQRERFLNLFERFIDK